MRADQIEQGKYCFVQEVTKLSSETAVINVKKALKAWKKTANDRLAPVRACCYDTSVTDAVRAQAKEDLRKDKAIVDSYTDLISGLCGNIDKVYKSTSTDYQVRYIVDLKCPSSFWSVCSYMVCPAEGEVPSHLYLDKLVTSGASLCLKSSPHFDETEGSRVPIIKGAGVLMMHSLYSTAQRLGLSELRLKALDGSVRFYEKIGMTRHNPSTSDEYFSYTISENNFPVFLLDYMASKNLMPVDLSALDL